MDKLKQYVIGAMIGMCFEYAYRADSDVWHLPLIIGIFLSLIAAIDVITTSK